LQSLGVYQALYLAIGFIASALGSAAGAGGGFIAVPALAYSGLLIDFAVANSKAMVFVNSVVATARYRNLFRGMWRLVIASAIAMALTSYIGAYEVPRVPVNILKLVVSLAILGGGIRLLIPRRNPSSRRSTRSRRWVVPLAGAVAGFIAGVTGLGGGVVLVPMLYSAGIETMQCVAISIACIAISSTTALARHIMDSLVLPHVAIPLCAGAVAGGFVGPAIARRLGRKGLLRVFIGATLCVASIKMLVTSLLSLV